MPRHKIWIGVAAVAALLLTLALIPGSDTGQKLGGADKGRSSLLGSIVHSVGERFGGAPALETLPGYDAARYAALSDKDKIAYRDYLVRLDEDVRFLKGELKNDKPQLENAFQRLFPEQMKALAAREGVVDQASLATPEAAEFLKKQNEDRRLGGMSLKIELTQEMLIRFGPRLTREEKRKVEDEITRMAAALGH